MNTYLIVGLGGALGAIFRVFLSKFLPPFISNMPIKILIINILGCFLLGVLTALMALYWNASINMRHFLIQGFLGGFTTFSAFSLEFALLYEKGETITAFIYAILSVVLCLLFFFIGMKMFKIFS